ncbi:MAG: glycosyltransferase [Candidatus Peribacteria bacterium]|jgi:GT2 family glycosyltransferase|nr:glycosyltransferase [Candidatus Peribacteria bacterium]
MIDIIVPVYNNLDYTRLFIDSLDYQKDSEFSLIVIDNASSDGTRSFLKKLKKNYSIQIIYNDENLGYVKAINQGLKLCKNNIILFSNNDTILSSNLLSQMERNMGKYGILTPYTNALDGKDSNILLTPYTGKPILSEINVYAESLYLEF